MALAGRAVGLAELHGDGVATLAATIPARSAGAQRLDAPHDGL
ncbi:MAG TPA: hypothetical protein VFL59_02165 [Candidatus Nanopelagicales bacterium]|nr:hypothetical protein [Candidatus Nanopelagicales bacterium]